MASLSRLQPGNSAITNFTCIDCEISKTMLTCEDIQKAMIAELEVDKLEEVMQEAFEGKFHVKVDDQLEYVVCVGEDARFQAVKTHIEDSDMVHLFHPAFLQRHLKVRLSIEKIEKLQSLEDNELFMALLKSFDDFVEDAIIGDGAGSFLANYNHEEHEFEFNDNTIYYYRL